MSGEWSYKTENGKMLFALRSTTPESPDPLRRLAEEWILANEGQDDDVATANLTRLLERVVEGCAGVACAAATTDAEDQCQAILRHWGHRWALDPESKP